MSAAEPHDLIIVGGGPAGLSHAFWRLQRQPDLRVQVLEAAPRLGGWVHTEEIDGFQLEHGPQGFRPEAGVDDFLRATGLREHVVPCSESSKRRFLIRGGRVHELPGSPGSILRSRLLSLSGKLRLLFEPRTKSRSPEGESVAAFVARRFGKQTATFAEALMHGIYAGDAHALEVASTLPVATELEREHGSLLRGMRARRKQSSGERPPTVCTFPNGMQQCIDTLAAKLGDRARTNAAVTSISKNGDGYLVQVDDETLHAREVCVTSPPAPTAMMLQRLAPQISDTLSDIPTVNVASTYLGFHRDHVPTHVDGFGALAPQGEAGPVLGALFSSRVFPQQAPDGYVLLRVMSGGFAFPREIDRSDDDLCEQARDMLRKLFDIHHKPVLQQVRRARNAIPQYVSGHAHRMRTLHEQLASHPGLHLRGASYRKVSIVGQWAEGGSQP